jgi:hypothetical protein
MADTEASTHLRKVAFLAPDGDPLCPACGTQIMTPPGRELVAGEGVCPVCKASFEIGAKAAAKASELARLSRERP